MIRYVIAAIIIFFPFAQPDYKSISVSFLKVKRCATDSNLSLFCKICIACTLYLMRILFCLVSFCYSIQIYLDNWEKREHVQRDANKGDKRFITRYF